MQATIGNQIYSVSLNWNLAASSEEIDERREETGRDLGVVLRVGNNIVGAGFAESDERNPAPSAAALVALSHPGESVCAIEWAGESAGRIYWLVAVSSGAVVPGTDVLADDPDLISSRVMELAQDFGCRITGSASGAFGGDGAAVLSQPISKGLRRAASIAPLKAGASPLQLLILALLLIAIAAAAWWILQPDRTEQAAAPAIDRQAEMRQQAIAARNRQLSEDLSGFGVLRMVFFSRGDERNKRLSEDLSGYGAMALAKQTRGAGLPLERSAAMWKLTGKRCEGMPARTCTLTWRALSATATPQGLSSALEIPRERIAHDLRADVAAVSDALPGEGARIEASESTVLTGHTNTLVDHCRAFTGMGGSCILDPAQPAAIPNAQMLPPGLQYHRGRLSLAGSLGRLDALLPALDGPDLEPWVRADSLELDFEKLEFRLVGHYVVP